MKVFRAGEGKIACWVSCWNCCTFFERAQRTDYRGQLGTKFLLPLLLLLLLELTDGPSPKSSQRLCVGNYKIKWRRLRPSWCGPRFSVTTGSFFSHRVLLGTNFLLRLLNFAQVRVTFKIHGTANFINIMNKRAAENERTLHSRASRGKSLRRSFPSFTKPC